MSEINKCPFCGGKARVFRNYDTIQNEIGYIVKCENLNCLMSAGGTMRQTEEQAIEAWNTRKPMERIVERLKVAQKAPDAYVYAWDAYYKAIEIVKAGGVDEHD